MSFPTSAVFIIDTSASPPNLIVAAGERRFKETNLRHARPISVKQRALQMMLVELFFGKERQRAIVKRGAIQQR